MLSSSVSRWGGFMPNWGLGFGMAGWKMPLADYADGADGIKLIWAGLANFFVNELGCTASAYLSITIIPTPPITATGNKKKNSKEKCKYYVWKVNK